MRNLLLLSAVGMLASAAIAGPALAADLPVRMPAPVAVAPVYVPEWAGFYIGVHGGGGWDHATFDLPGIGNAPSTTLSGGLVGGHAGYNWQYGQVVAGLEVDYSSADLRQSSLIDLAGLGLVQRNGKVDELASARGRLGWTWMPNLLLYGTGGLGFAHAHGSLSSPGFFFTSADETATGWVAGAGLEYRVFEHLLLRAEYLHYGMSRISFPDLVPGFDANVRNDIDVVRGGISYKF